MFKLQMDYHGRFRILYLEAVSNEQDTKLTEVAGAWVPYRSIATLKHAGRTYIACSAYGGLPMVETVYDITIKATSLDDSMCHTDSVDGKVYEPAL